jgi:hypothetical protein
LAIPGRKRPVFRFKFTDQTFVALETGPARFILPQQPLTIRAMWVVTGQAIRFRKGFVDILPGSKILPQFRMTAITKFSLTGHQQLLMFGDMGVVTFLTFPRGYRFVGKFTDKSLLGVATITSWSSANIPGRYQK